MTPENLPPLLNRFLWPKGGKFTPRACTTPQHLPAEVQSDIRSALAGPFRLYATDPSDVHLFTMMGFPKLFLRTVQVWGLFAHGQWIASMRDRLDLFRQGNLAKLWELLQADLARRPGSPINAAGGKRKTSGGPSWMTTP